MAARIVSRRASSPSPRRRGGTQVDAGAVVQAQLQIALRRQADAVALAAERVGHGADKAHMAPEAREGHIGRRAVAQADPAGGGGAVNRFQATADLLHGHGGVVLPAADGHHFDEAHLQRHVLGQARDGGDLAVVHAPDGDAVDFHAVKAQFQGPVDAGAGVGKAVGAGDAGKGLRRKGIQTEIDAVDARRLQCPGHGREEDAVGGQIDLLDAGHGVEGGDEVRQSVAHQRLAAGEPQAAHPQGGENTHQGRDLLIAEDVTVGHPADALLGHAVYAAQIAPVGDGNAQIIDGPSELVFHTRTPLCGL